MTPEERETAFLEEYIPLVRRYQVWVTNCGCCGKEGFLETIEEYAGAEGLPLAEADMDRFVTELKEYYMHDIRNLKRIERKP